MRDDQRLRQDLLALEAEQQDQGGEQGHQRQRLKASQQSCEGGLAARAPAGVARRSCARITGMTM